MADVIPRGPHVLNDAGTRCRFCGKKLPDTDDGFGEEQCKSHVLPVAGGAGVASPAAVAAAPTAMQVLKFEMEADCVLRNEATNRETGSGDEKCRICIDTGSQLALTLPARNALRLGCVPYVHADGTPLLEEVDMPDGRSVFYCAMSPLTVIVPLPATVEGAAPAQRRAAIMPFVLYDDLMDKKCQTLLKEAYQLQRASAEKTEGYMTEDAAATNKKRTHDEAGDVTTLSATKLARTGTTDSASSTAATAAALSASTSTDSPPLSPTVVGAPRYVPVSPPKLGSGQPSFLLGSAGAYRHIQPLVRVDLSRCK